MLTYGLSAPLETMADLRYLPETFIQKDPNLGHTIISFAKNCDEGSPNFSMANGVGNSPQVLSTSSTPSSSGGVGLFFGADVNAHTVIYGQSISNGITGATTPSGYSSCAYNGSVSGCGVSCNEAETYINDVLSATVHHGMVNAASGGNLSSRVSSGLQHLHRRRRNELHRSQHGIQYMSNEIAGCMASAGFRDAGATPAIFRLSKPRWSAPSPTRRLATTAVPPPPLTCLAN
jgi:hypothetical protein